MRMTPWWLLVLLPVALPAQGRSGGADPGAAARAALSPLAGLVGQWEGEARISQGPGEPMRVRQVEDVVFGAGNTVLMIRGTGRSTDPSNRDAIVFEAAATVWFDADSARLRMRAHRAEGIAVEPDLELRPDTLIWGFAVPGGRVRYVTHFTATDWHEVGHFVREGAPPVPFIDMRLKKVR